MGETRIVWWSKQEQLMLLPSHTESSLAFSLTLGNVAKTVSFISFLVLVFCFLLPYLRPPPSPGGSHGHFSTRTEIHGTMGGTWDHTCGVIWCLLLLAQHQENLLVVSYVDQRGVLLPTQAGQQEVLAHL